MKVVNGKDWNGTSCAHLGCGSHGKWAPTLVLRAGVQFGPRPPALLEIDFLICTRCKAELKPMDLMSDAARTEIERVFKEAGRALPDWARTKIEWRFGMKSDFPAMKGS